ncbi:MAG: hypothetical protein ACJ77M_18095 [Thermoleophilaceae bacterium]
MTALGAALILMGASVFAFPRFWEATVHQRAKLFFNREPTERELRATRITRWILALIAIVLGALAVTGAF